MEIKALTNSTEKEICEAFNETFAVYVIPMHLTYERFLSVAKRRGADYELSMGAYMGKKLVGFVINAIDVWRGKKTIYDCFTGIIPDYRGKGIGKKLLEKSIQNASESGIEQYLLEVITHNAKAHEMYLKRGFEVVREFTAYKGLLAELTIPYKKDSDFNVVKQAKTPDWDLMKQFWDVNPSWQNSMDAINRVNEEMVFYTALKHKHTVAYLVMEDKSGDVVQLAVSKDYRKRGIGTALLKEATKNRNDDFKLSFINVESSCTSFENFAQTIGIKKIAKQYEMVKKL